MLQTLQDISLVICACLCLTVVVGGFIVMSIARRASGGVLEIFDGDFDLGIITDLLGVGRE